MKKTIGFACDHAGFKLKNHLICFVEDMGYKTMNFGTNSEKSCDYPDFAHPLAKAVEANECYPGIAICGSGNGINMTLNKHQQIRAALCWENELASLARKHNNANILVMPGRFISKEKASEILTAFLGTDFEGGRHQKRIDKIACQ